MRKLLIPLLAALALPTAVNPEELIELKPINQHSYLKSSLVNETNFIFCKPLDHSGNGGAQIANSLYSFLSTRGILVRYFPQNKLTESYIRISIGMPEEMSMLISKIKEWQLQEQLK